MNIKKGVRNLRFFITLVPRRYMTATCLIVTAICLTIRQLALYNCHLPLFLINRLSILSDAFLIEVFPLYSVVFTYSYYRGPLLNIVLVDAREYKPLLFNICLSCDVYILKRFSRCFSEFF
jgi:hypothetical protein